MKIEYEYEYMGNIEFLKTVCPNGTENKVGSINCITCKYNICYSYNKKYVECAYLDEILKEIDKKNKTGGMKNEK